MTLDNIKQEFFKKIDGEDLEILEFTWEENKSWFFPMIKSYAEQKCKEQREICAEKVLDSAGDYAAVVCAEPPKFD